MTGAPIDSSIRKMIIKSKSIGSSVPDSQPNLDPLPQLLMAPGSEQFSFQYDDGNGDGRDKYKGFNDAGGGAADPSTAVTIDDFISVMVEKPTNKTYTIGYNIPIPVQILNSSFVFGVGPGTASFQTGTIPIGGNITMIVTGTSGASSNLLARVATRINQAG